MKVKNDERIKVFENERILVVEPLTHKASCKYGAYTQWCTAVVSNPDYFKRYSARGILLYIIIKSPYDDVKNKEYKIALNIADHGCTWYDQADNEFSGNPMSSLDEMEMEEFDPRIIRFLIPETVSNTIVKYGEEKYNELKIKNKNLTIKVFRDLLKDSNTKIITKNKELVMFYNTEILDPEKFPTEHDSNLSDFFEMQNNHKPDGLMIYIYNKRKNVGYSAYCPYKYDHDTFTNDYNNRMSYDEYGTLTNVDNNKFKNLINENLEDILTEYKLNNNDSVNGRYVKLGKYINVGEIVYEYSMGRYIKLNRIITYSEGYKVFGGESIEIREFDMKIFANKLYTVTPGKTLDELVNITNHNQRFIFQMGT